MESKSIKDCSILELKAHAYDRIMQAERIQRELQVINAELAQRENGETDDKAAVTKPNN